MTANAVALLLLALGVGVASVSCRAPLAASARCRDSSGYAESVLTGPSGAMPVAAPEGHALEIVRPLVVVALAALLAAVSLLGARIPRRDRESWRRVMHAIYDVPRRIHSGHVGDYVTWLLLGIAASTGIATLAAR